MFFVPLVTLPFQMSKDLIWAVSKCTTWLSLLSQTAVAEDPSLALAVNSSESLHEYGQS